VKPEVEANVATYPVVARSFRVRDRMILSKLQSLLLVGKLALSRVCFVA